MSGYIITCFDQAASNGCYRNSQRKYATGNNAISAFTATDHTITDQRHTSTFIYSNQDACLDTNRIGLNDRSFAIIYQYLASIVGLLLHVVHDLYMVQLSYVRPAYRTIRL